MRSFVLRNSNPVLRFLPAISLLLVFMLSFSSCKDENEAIVADPNLLGLPKVMSELYQDGNQVGDLNGKVTYNGSKITEIFYNSTQKKVFTYTGDLITKIEHYQAGTIRFTHTYRYTDGKLVEYTNNDQLTGNRDHITYIHQPDGTIAYEQVYSFNGRDDWKKTGELTFVNQNVTEDIALFTFLNVSDEYNIIANVLEYNDKPNPFRNITGYNALLNLKGTIGTHNITSDYTYTSSFKNGVQYAESLMGKEYEFAYDKEGRTTQIDRYSNEKDGGEILYLDRIFKFQY
jgi:hypothetical protein